MFEKKQHYNICECDMRHDHSTENLYIHHCMLRKYIWPLDRRTYVFLKTADVQSTNIQRFANVSKMEKNDKAIQMEKDFVIQVWVTC